MDKRCKACYYVAQCAKYDGRGDQCEYYTYAGLDVDDEEYTDQRIEDARIDFADQWQIYLSEEE